MLFEVSPKRDTDSSASPAFGCAAAESRTRVRCRSSLATRKSTATAAYASAACSRYTSEGRMPRRSHTSPLSEAMLLELVGDVVGLLDLQELRRGMLAALARVLPSQYISLNEVGPAGVIATVMYPDDS